MNPKVDEYLLKQKSWQNELSALRKIILDCGLSEELKWAKPCYSLNNRNIAILVPFKHHCAIGFFKGSLLCDSAQLLSQAGEYSQSGRQMRFTGIEEIHEKEKEIRAYIFEAIEVEKSGLKTVPTKRKEPEIPDELLLEFESESAFKKAFEQLTPGRQRGYLLHFSAAKQSSTRKTRIEKYRKRILDGKGINDCVCGLSKRKPNCDGSHKFLKNGLTE